MITLIKTIIKGLAEGIYRVLKALNLQYAFLVLVTWLVLYLVGVSPSGSTVFTVFQILLVISIVLAIGLTVYKMVVSSASPKKDKQTEVSPDINAEHTATVKKGASVKHSADRKEKPRYYRVAQNPRYIMAEYSDRCILYYQNGNRLKHIRTDFKDETAVGTTENQI